MNATTIAMTGPTTSDSNATTASEQEMVAEEAVGEREVAE
jgi:hypothetical protein